MKNVQIFSLLARSAVMAAAVVLFSSCAKREGQLDIQILTHTVWYGQSENMWGATVERLYEFDEGGMVSIYRLSHGEAVSDKQCHYIFTPSEELLAIESVGAFHVEEIDVEAITLEDIESGKTFVFRKYKEEISLP